MLVSIENNTKSILQRRKNKFIAKCFSTTVSNDNNHLDDNSGLLQKSPVLDKRDIEFNLSKVLDVEEGLFNLHTRFNDHTMDIVLEALKTAEQVSIDKFLNHNRKNDLNEPHFDPKTNKVTIIPEVTEGLKAFNENGFNAAHADYDLDGMQLPSVVTNSLMFPFFAGNVGTSTFPFLTIAAGNMLRKYGTESQIDRYLKPMLQGRFTGTMNLSETQAGSSLADITTKAFPKANGKYSIKGNKMWISGGEHSLSENIVHMVLAKVSDPENPERTEAGVKGISLFLVPKKRVNEQNEISDEVNDISLGGLNHKMGWRGATNCVMNYGENDLCEGELLGEEGKGLAVMFMMMNEARISVGLIATALGYAGYYQSLHYASERQQGRSLTERDPKSKQIPIIQHADVKRMLLAQKSYVEGALSLCLYGSKLVDHVHHPEGEMKEEDLKEAAILLDVLTPIIKSWPSEYCLEANKHAIQVHGGYGYTRDYSVEQHYRDNRLNLIHEGTNGIQSLDLLGRKVTGRTGKAGLKIFADTISRDISALTDGKNKRGKQLSKLLDNFVKVTNKLSDLDDRELMLINSHEYLLAAGHLTIGWMWLRQESAAQSALDNDPNMSKSDKNFYHGKIHTSKYFFAHELPKANHSINLLKSLDTKTRDMNENYF